MKANYLVAVANNEEADAALLEAESAKLQSEANLAQAQDNLGAADEDNVQLRAAKAAVEQAELNLEFTKVKASVDGYVTNLQLLLGSQAVPNQPALALVDVNSYWVDAYLRETFVGSFLPGDAAVVKSILPISLVVNVASGTEGDQAKVASGEYNKMIDNKIAEIKQQCGM